MRRLKDQQQIVAKMVLFILPISLPLRFRFPPSQHFGSFTFLLSFAKRLQHNTPTKTRVRELVAISRTGDGREFARKKRCNFSDDRLFCVSLLSSLRFSSFLLRPDATARQGQGRRRRCCTFQTSQIRAKIFFSVYVQLCTLPRISLILSVLPFACDCLCFSP